MVTRCHKQRLEACCVEHRHAQRFEKVSVHVSVTHAHIPSAELVVSWLLGQHATNMDLSFSSRHKPSARRDKTLLLSVLYHTTTTPQQAPREQELRFVGQTVAGASNKQVLEVVQIADCVWKLCQACVCPHTATLNRATLACCCCEGSAQTRRKKGQQTSGQCGLARHTPPRCMWTSLWG